MNRIVASQAKIASDEANNPQWNLLREDGYELEDVGSGATRIIWGKECECK